MNKKDIRAVMAEVGCPLAQGTPPSNGGKPSRAHKSSKNVIDLRGAVKGYDSSMSWKDWVDFMLAAYNLKSGVRGSKRDLANTVMFVATGQCPKSSTMIYRQRGAQRDRIAEILVRMVHSNEILFNTDTATTRSLASRMGIPSHVVTRMVYDRMMSSIEWTRLKLAYMQERGISDGVDRRVLVSGNADLIELFHETAAEMLEKMSYSCPVMQCEMALAE